MIEPSAATKELPLVLFYEPDPLPANTTYVETLKAHLDYFEQGPFKDMDMQGIVTKAALLDASGATFKELYGNKNIRPAAAKLLRKLTKFSRYFHDSLYLVRQARKYTQYDFKIEEASEPPFSLALMHPSALTAPATLILIFFFQIRPTTLEPAGAISPAAVVAALLPQLPSNVSFDLDIFIFKTGCSQEDFKSAAEPTRHLVHCECTLVAHLLTNHNNRANKVPLRIGMSKRCCLPCAQLLLILSKEKRIRILSREGEIETLEEKGKIKISGCSGKVYPNWGFPSKLLGSLTHAEMTKEMRNWAVKAITTFSTRKFTDPSGGKQSPDGSDKSDDERETIRKLSRRRVGKRRP